MNIIVNKKFYKNILGWLLFGIAFGIIIIRCFYGINFDDELAYISVVKRMVEGQWIVLNDWNAPTLLSSWLTFQMIKFTGVFQLESIVIAFRIIYILFQSLVAICLYVWFRKEKFCTIGILVYLFSTPYNINTLSYNTLSIGFMLLVCGFITSRSVWKKWNYILLGILYSLCVLSNPYTILLFLAYVILKIFYWKKNKNNIVFLSDKAFGYLTLGCFIMFFIFFISMLSHGSLMEYIDNGILLLNDKEHNSNLNLFGKITMAVYKTFRIYWRISIPMFFITLLTILSSKVRQHKHLLILLSVLSTMYGIIRFSFIYGSVYPNLMLVAINFIGVEVYLLTVNKLKKVFWGWYVLGCLFAICIFVGTNTGILSGSAAFVVPSIACVLMLFQLCKELSPTMSKDKISKVLIYLLIILEISCIFWLRLSYIWTDGEFRDLNFQIMKGPCKYLYTSEENYTKYNRMLEVVEEINVNKNDKVLFLPMRPLYYLSVNGQYASPYTKRFLVNFEEIKSYFNQDLERLPNVIIDCLDGEEDELEEIEKTWEWFKNMGYIEEIKPGYRKLVK